MSAEPILSRLKQTLGADRRIFGSVTPAAQSAVAALLALESRGNTWIFCPDVRRQEEIAADLATWGVRAAAFPPIETIGENDVIADPEILSERLEILARPAAGTAGQTIVAVESELEGRVAAPESFHRDALKFVPRQRVDLAATESALAKGGYDCVPKLFGRGQFARRGGILDIYSWQHPLPVRIELFDDEVESIREFQLDSQISVGPVERCEIMLGDPDRKLVPLETYFAKADARIAIDCAPPVANAIIREETDGDAVAFFPPGIDFFQAGDFVLNEAKRARFFGQIREWTTGGWLVTLVCNNEGEWERFGELARDNGLDPSTLAYLQGSLTAGFTCPAARLAVLSDAELFGRASSQRARRSLVRRERAMAARTAVDFTEFEPGDLVVHLDHGIGRYLGMEKPDGGADQLAIEFAEGSRLFVPLDQAWQVSRYVGLGKRNPPLSELGDGKWQRAIGKAQRSIFDYAATMLRLQAERDTSLGHAFGPDTHWQQEFERSFVFQPTPDQARAIDESKADMEATRPMDRLICGDVGFGKTEVAIRAAFKAVMGGRQVAFLAPTTVLAQQHCQTLRERMSDYPITVEALHRFRSRAEQTRAVKGLLDGSVDIVVGTHRLLSEDVVFKNLGLVIVDEEQRFGVKHKERLKERFRLVDVLTLSATPIPRTLYLALMGARDMSLIETPPPNRQPVETVICAYDERVMRDAVQREIHRGGQIYLLHNRVLTIEKLAARVRALCPGARVGVGHGQMDEHELETMMAQFVAGRIDVLVSTTIIESGLDIPNANTIIIDRADRFGLADLYQLRGRVGRSHHKAYAYLMLPRDLMASGIARKRVLAIRQYSELGAGFKIAMRDLEIRGAGNILGTAQSGHILAVGFDLYCRLLKRSIATLKGEPGRTGAAASVRLDFLSTGEPEFLAAGDDKAPAFLPSAYVADPPARIDAYRKLADAPDKPALDRLRDEWRDRFGPLPPAAENLLALQSIRLLAAEKRIPSVETRGDKLMLKKKGDYVLFGGKFPRLTSPSPENRLREVSTFLQKRPLL
ncbi:MAG: transcription-repair coupling factor [Terrimicrobiaceae bacterium]|nr:transcription-repair coupling factor [Terrimicrobiaceae bacterium]